MGSDSKTVCVTGASGFIGSWARHEAPRTWLYFRATVRDPKGVKHLLDLPKANSHLTLWKADLSEEGSFDAAINGCFGVFHVATPMDFESKDPEMYFVSKTLAEQAAWKFAKENNLDFISIIPTLVIGPYLMPSMPPSLITGLSPITAEGRYICSSHAATIVELANMLREKYPEYNIPTKFKDADENLGNVNFSSKKLQDLGFQFKYSLEDMFVGAVETCRAKGLIPAPINPSGPASTDQVVNGCTPISIETTVNGKS
ncbi:Bifunctional dihydroflavonol 4-reductase/flavanone 4-reductase [Hibiscus syriacus]|uniref:Bifunctional dihydroflavonol 4-reductase/flavanone 4-reductase n=1 Tax=Hibiscus syriacus TaxID=106335 RepID=A0A6A3CN63_HIBSY|nr:Bifunctional dihydroflavonol 4-reductase/flavanone 4-reductase [Hibiscus syriacus]